MKSLVAIVGPTATGKSDLAVHLALSINGEIVGADSRQVYRHMDIGTAKPDPELRRLVPHHLIDIVDPSEPFSLALYRKLALEAIEGIHNRGRLPLLVGGTGQYVWALLEGWQAPEAPPDGRLRAELEAQSRADGGEALYRRLQALDPDAGARIDPRNVRRVIRALEVIEATGQPFSRFQTRKAPPWNILIIGLTTSREELYRRIDERVERMVAVGWVEEVRRLLEMGYSWDLPALSSLGYRDLVAHVRGDLALDEAVQQAKWATHAYVRRQYAWFRLDDARIRWYDVASEDVPGRVVKDVRAWLDEEAKARGECVS